MNQQKKIEALEREVKEWKEKHALAVREYEQLEAILSPEKRPSLSYDTGRLAGILTRIIAEKHRYEAQALALWDTVRILQNALDVSITGERMNPDTPPTVAFNGPGQLSRDY